MFLNKNTIIMNYTFIYFLKQAVYGKGKVYLFKFR